MDLKTQTFVLAFKTTFKEMPGMFKQNKLLYLLHYMDKCIGTPGHYINRNFYDTPL